MTKKISRKKNMPAIKTTEQPNTNSINPEKMQDIIKKYKEELNALNAYIVYYNIFFNDLFTNLNELWTNRKGVVNGMLGPMPVNPLFPQSRLIEDHKKKKDVVLMAQGGIAQQTMKVFKYYEMLPNEIAESIKDEVLTKDMDCAIEMYNKSLKLRGESIEKFDDLSNYGNKERVDLYDILEKITNPLFPAFFEKIENLFDYNEIVKENSIKLIKNKVKSDKGFDL